MGRAKFFGAQSNSLLIWHQFDLSRRVGRGKQYGWPIFELDQFTKQECHHLRSCERLIVCSKWAKEVVVNSINCNPDTISVIPLGVDTDIFKPLNRASQDKTVFISIGKIELRKGHDIILEAFNKAFTLRDNVELWMMWNSPLYEATQFKQYVQEWTRYYISSALSSKIRILPFVPSHSQLADLMQQVDCGFFCSRAEGWNLSCLELMSCGKPSIVTNCTGHTEYCNEHNSFLIEPTGVELAYDGIWFKNQGHWHTFNVDDFVDRLREVHKLKSSGSFGQLSEKCIETAQKFTWLNTAKKVEEICCH